CFGTTSQAAARKGHRMAERMLFGDEHVKRYEETNGEVGHIWVNGAPCLILTTKGRKTGKEYKHALIYQKVDEGYVIIASKGGAPDHPGWYKNLMANPEVKVQVGAEKFTARARTVEDEPRRKELWSIMTKVWPAYDEYQEKTDRKIPVVVLEPAA